MKPIFITDAGKALIAAAVGGENKINFTRICTFKSVISENISDPEIAQSTVISGVVRSENLCEVYGILDNSELHEGYYIRSLGLFADNEGSEILFGFCDEDSEAFYMPASTNNSKTEVTLRIALNADCSDSVSISPNSDAYASAVMLHEEIAKLENLVTQKINEHDLSSEAHNELLKKNNVISGKLSELSGRLEVVETVLQGDISANIANVSFGNLSGVEFNGIWNNSLSRLEF